MTPSPRFPHLPGFRAYLDAEQWLSLHALGRRRGFAEGERLLDQGSRGEVVRVLLQGRVRVVIADSEGEEALIAVRGPGDLVGEYAHLDSDFHMASVWALDDCETTAVPGEAFGGFVRRERLDKALQRYMLGKTRQAGERLRRAARLQVEQRMAELFLEILRADPARDSLTIPMTQTLVAESLGASRRQVADLLAQWRARGVVKTRPAIVVLDLEALVRRANRP